MKSRIIFFYFLFLNIICAAQQRRIIFNQITLKNEIFGKINGLTQDQQGYMWIATNDGLYRYDGANDVYYKHDPSDSNSLSHNELSCICTSKQGNVYLGTNGSGLDILDPVTGIFKHFRHDPKNENSLISNYVSSLTIDYDSTLWIGTLGGLDHFNYKTGKFNHYTHSDTDSLSLSNNHIRVIYLDKEKTLWIGTGSPYFFNDGIIKGEGGLNRLNRQTGKFTRYLANPKDPHSLIDNSVGAILEDKHGNFWIGTGGDGLHTMDRKNGTFERHLYNPQHPENLSRPPVKNNHVYYDDFIAFIIEDATGMIWIGTMGGGVNCYNPITNKTTNYILTSYSSDGTLQFKDSSAFKAFSSRDGVIWIATYGNRLYSGDPYFMKIPYIPVDKSVYIVFQDSNNKRYIGTIQGLIEKDLKTGSEKLYMHDSSNPKTISNDVIGLIKRSKDGQLWIGNDACLDKFDPKKKIFKHYRFDSANEHIYDKTNVNDILEDKNNLWLGTRDGLYLMNQQTGKFLTSYKHNPNDSSSISNNIIVFLYRDREQRIWTGNWNNGGLNLFNAQTGKFKHYLKNKDVSFLFEDHKGTIWASTNEGLYFLNSGKDSFVTFSYPDKSIKFDKILYLFEDKFNNFWVCTEAAFYRFDAEKKVVNIFDTNFGVRYIDYGYCLLTYDPQGEVFIVDKEGYYIFNPDSITTNKTPPEILFGDFQIKNKDIISEATSSVSTPIWKAKEIHLDYSQNTFTIYFSVIHYSNPGNNKASYMLTNYDDGWRNANTDRRAYYYNVPPGKYIFKVKAASSYNLWTEKDLIIIISPPWWKTWWAYSLFIILVASGVYLIYRNRINNLKIKQQQQIKTMVSTQEEERKRISRDLHDDVGTKLSALKLFISSFKNNINKHQYSEAELLAENSEQLINETMRDVRGMLLNLSPSVLEEFGYTVAVETLVNKINEARVVNFKLVLFGIAKRLPQEYELALYRITQELINNVLKHAESKNVDLQIGYRDRKIVLMIEDDGKGFDVSAHKDGYGLKNLEARTKLLNGIIHIDSSPGKGTSTLIEIPFQM